MIIEGIIATFDPELNFWELHPTFLTLDTFKKFYNRDRSENKERSSREMWGFAFMYDMGSANFMRNLATDTKMDTIAKDVIKNVKYDWTKEKEVSDQMQELCQPKPQRALYDLYEKVKERTDFINSTEYTLDKLVENAQGKPSLVKGTADQLDKMMVNTTKIFEQIEFWQKKIAVEREIRSTRNLSESQTGEM